MMSMEKTIISAISSARAKTARKNESSANPTKPLVESTENSQPKAPVTQSTQVTPPTQASPQKPVVPVVDSAPKPDSSNLQLELARKKSAGELAAARKYRKKLTQSGPKDRARSEKLKKAFAKIPKAVLARRGAAAGKARKRMYGESLSQTRDIIDSINKSKKPFLSFENYRVIKQNLMDHLFSSIAEGYDGNTVYKIILHDIAPLMQVTEAIAERKGIVNPRDISVLESYQVYLGAMDDEIQNG